MKHAEWIARGVTAGFALFALLAHWLLATDVSVWSGWLPIALLVGLGLARQWPTSPAPDYGDVARNWQWVTALVVLGIAVVAVAYGSVATPPRAWDGANYWDVRARVFFDAPTLQQTFFTQDAVYVQTREYPLTQPLALASAMRLLGADAGRLVFPLLYVTMLVTFASALRRTVAATWVPLFAVCFGVTPMLTDSTMGSVDSGFGDFFVCFCVTALAAGMLAKDRLLLFAGAALVVLVKPEGLFYAPIAAAAVWGFGKRREFVPIVVGWAVGALTWLPLYFRLTSRESPRAVLWAGVLVVASAAIGSKTWLDRRDRHAAVPIAILLALPIVAFLVAAALRSSIPNGDALSAYLSGTDRILERLRDLPTILVGHLQYMFMVRRMGLVFGLVFLLALVPRRYTARCPSPALAAFLVIGWLFLFVPFLASPETDLRHHLRSSMDRLLEHWLGACWLLVGVWLPAAVVHAKASEKPHSAA